MLPYSVWEGLDRQSFFENAILLDLKARSQGMPTTARLGQDKHDVLLGGDLSRQMVRDFLDDFALVAAGDGGKNNVSATCIEIRDQDQIVILRVAKNEGLSEPTKAGLNSITRLMTKSISIEAELHQRKEEILLEILSQCTGRLFKHIQRFINELRNAQCRPAGQYAIPMYLPDADQTEALKDVQRLGTRCRENHEIYMQTCESRLNQLRGLSSKLVQQAGGHNLQEMVVLTKETYDVRRSSAFRQFLQSNLQNPRRAIATTATVNKILERLGKISRFYRAAVTFTAVGVKLLEKNMTIQIEGVPALKFQITELCYRTPAQLHLRGGHKYFSCSEHQLQGMINRWPKYRLHSEMQLLIFYEENPDLFPQESYIGCDKLSCYLCHSFITSHSQFKVKGCHQSLYSLWTVPNVVSFGNKERAEAFQNSLKALCDDLEQKIRVMRDRQTIRGKQAPNNESVANLSRLSLPLTISMVEQGSKLQAACEDILSDSQNRCVEVEEPSAPQSNLNVIPEVPLQEYLQENAESDQAEQLEANQSVIEVGREKATLEIDVMGSNPVATDMVSMHQSTRGDKRQEVLAVKRPSKNRQHYHSTNEVQIRRHAQNPRLKRKTPAHRARKNKKSDVCSQDRVRQRMRRNHHDYAKWRHGERRWLEGDRFRVQDRRNLGSAKITQRKQGFWSRFWLTCTIVVRGCFGEARKPL